MRGRSRTAYRQWKQARKICLQNRPKTRDFFVNEQNIKKIWGKTEFEKLRNETTELKELEKNAKKITSEIKPKLEGEQSEKYNR